VRRSALRVLDRLGPGEGVAEALATATADEVPDIRREAIRVLVSLGDYGDDQRAALEQAAQSPDAQVRDAAERRLTELRTAEQPA
jgi:HEAT repeat protein